MAPISGRERLLAIGHTNTVSFVRAVQANCKTSAPSLAGRDGRLTLESLVAGREDVLAGKEHPFQQMCCQPWAWLVISCDVEEAFPDLPTAWSSALNGTHAVGRRKKEVECAAEIAAYCSLGSTVEEAVCLTAAGEPECSSYLHDLATLVRLYGGAQNVAAPGQSKSFPLIAFIDEYSKLFGSSLKMGEEFTSAVCGMTFWPGESTSFPHLRIGLFAVQSTSTKEADGYARQLSRSDVEKLRAKDRLCKAFRTLILKVLSV